MVDALAIRRRAHLKARGVGPAMAERIMANVRWQGMLPHIWVGDAVLGRRCCECEMTEAEAATGWPGEGIAPCIGMVVRS